MIMGKVKPCAVCACGSESERSRVSVREIGDGGRTKERRYFRLGVDVT